MAFLKVPSHFCIDIVIILKLKSLDMKTFGLLLAGCLCFCCLAFVAYIEPTSNFNPNGDISFYQTNLVCAAATDIGCGTRAKPVLVDFEKHPNVKEAWLNHAGTVIAVIWDDKVGENKSGIAKKVFASYNLTFTELTGNTSQKYLTDFIDGDWYRGKEVDELSKIEAGRIADQVMEALNQKTTISENVAPKMRTDLEAFFKDELLSIEDANVIYSGSYWKKWDEGIADIGEKYLGKGNFPEFSIYSASASKASCTNSSASGKSCCSSGSNKSCCSKNKSQ